MLTYDKRGHGLSDIGQSPYRIDDHVNDLVALMDRLEISNAVICGLSVGGLIAMRLSTVRPDLVSSLVLCDTAPKIGTEPMWEERMEIARRDGMAGLVKANMERWFTRNFHTHHTAELDGYSNMFLRVPLEGISRDSGRYSRYRLARGCRENRPAGYVRGGRGRRINPA